MLAEGFPPVMGSVTGLYVPYVSEEVESNTVTPRQLFHHALEVKVQKAFSFTSSFCMLY